MSEEDDFIMLLIQPTDEEQLAWLKAQETKGKRIQVWHLKGMTNDSSDGAWSTLEQQAKFVCPVHLYRVHPEDV